jgi:hypothetical protein
MMELDPHTPALRATPLKRGIQAARVVGNDPLLRGVPDGRSVSAPPPTIGCVHTPRTPT